ncbi:MAG: hypothetical protein HY908_00870 [Myxococcales bacterium]|nr:hypothetical protein [Myxococcales bacterium]
MTKRIGLLVGWEESFPVAFLERANALPGVEAGLVRIGGIGERHVEGFDVLVDRVSHKVKHYRSYLKAAAIAGAYIINDPFWSSADDKFVGYTLAARLGVAVPRTVMLPQKTYPPAVVPERSLRNLEYPLDWRGIVETVGFPAVLKPADGSGAEVSIVTSAEGLLAAYDASGTSVMVLQELIAFDRFVRCLCLGQDQILPLEYDPHRRCYLPHDDERWLPQDLHDRIVGDARTLNRALGYDLNLVELAVRDGVPYALDFTNPAPALHREQLPPHAFDRVVDGLVTLAVERAGRARTRDAYRFGKLLG